ncbi:interaptin-like [Montipora capricornis]|uniref:interaptin-like n=1 Tax=Montipora capricornis TaxID=246305 RepID=UPI0035F1FBA7
MSRQGLYCGERIAGGFCLPEAHGAAMQLRRERMHDDQICQEIATLENVLRYAMVRATKDVNQELDQSSIENMTLDRFVALYLIGPRRLVARLSDPQYSPNDEKHTRVLRELCGKISEQMGHSVMATAAAKRTEELISRHRQDIWSNGAAMVPGIQQEGVPSVSDGLSVYQPSILDGSWTAGENVEDIDSEIDESDQEYHNDQIHLESQEDDGEISDDNGEMFQLLQEREASETTKYTPGMLPVSKFLTPSETSDSLSTYAPSSLSRFSKATKQREPTMVEDITLSNDDGYDERSTYTASSLSKHLNRERDNAPPVLDSSLHHHGQPGLISAEQMSRRDDEKLTQYNPSEFSEFNMPRPLPLINTDANHLSFLPSIVEDEDDDDPIRSMASAGIEQTAQWVAGAIALTQDDQNIAQKGAATNALMVDNERLAQTLSVHRASEHGLTFVLTQAQKELGQTTAQLVEQREITNRLRQTLDDQNIQFRYEMDKLQNDLKTQEEIANQAQTALNELRERLAKQVAEEGDQMRVHRNSEEGLEIATQARNAYETFKVKNTQHVEDIEAQARQTIEELTRELENRKSQIAELQNIRQEVLNAQQATENELVAVRAQLEKNNQEAATLHDENKQLQTRVVQITEDTNQKDGAIRELQTKVHTIIDNYELAKEEAKRLFQEQRGYQDHIQILQNNVRECTRLGETRIAELSKQNKDIQDAFHRSNKEKDVLSRLVESNKQSQQNTDDQKDRQILMTEEARQRLENDLQETRLEVIDKQKLIDEVLPVISRLRDVVETNQQQKQAITESDIPRVVEDVTTVIREQEKRLQNTFRELAHSIGVVDTNGIHDLVQKIQTDLKATREALVHLSREEDSDNQSDISRMPSSHLVRLAQERFAQMGERVKQTDHTLDALKKITNSDRSDDVIKRMQEVMKEKNAIQDGLKQLTDTVVSSSSVDLIKIAQEKFRSLNQLYKEASSEVNSLRRHLDELQEQFEKQKTEYLRKKEDYLREIQELSSIVTRVDSEKSQKADQNREFEITLNACKENLTRAITECDLISDEKQKIEEKYTRYQTECYERFLDLDAEIERLNREIKQTKTRNEELERTNKDRESLRTEEKLEYETNQQILQDQIGECQNQLHLVEQKLDQKTKEYRQLLREHENAQIEWQKQVDSFNIQLDEAAPSRLTEIRLERDQLTRNASELEARLQHLQEIHQERDRLASLNEQLTRQLQELREARRPDHGTTTTPHSASRKRTKNG